MEKQQPFPKRAADASCLGGLAAWIIPVMLRGSSKTLSAEDARSYAILIGTFSAVIMIIGAALAIVALRGMRQHGRSGIFTPAILGLLLNGIGIALFFLGFLSAPRTGYP